MDCNIDGSALGELFESIIFLYESKKGKYSLDSYLEIVGEYADQMIKKTEADGLIYLGGECAVLNNQDEHIYEFCVKLYFENNNAEQILKEASRKLSKENFTSETERKIGSGKKFEIQRPE